ncbi:MAG: hypothetical protein ACK6DS_01460 [Planctomycetota bacterium]
MPTPKIEANNQPDQFELAGRAHGAPSGDGLPSRLEPELIF